MDLATNDVHRLVSFLPGSLHLHFYLHLTSPPSRMQARNNRSHLDTTSGGGGNGSDDPLAKVLAPPPDESPDDRDERLRREAVAQRVSDEIDERIRLDRVAFKKKNDLFKLLLLGQSESGKSTTLKSTLPSSSSSSKYHSHSRLARWLS